MQERQNLSEFNEFVNNLNNEINDANELLELYEDDSFMQELHGNLTDLKIKCDKFKLKLMLDDDPDNKLNCYIEIHPGAGGMESEDFAGMVWNMYKKWADRNGFKYDQIETFYVPHGIKSATLLIHGEYAYGYLKNETGVHKLARHSPYDSNGRRHTSFISVNVYPEIDREINIEINPSDLNIQAYIASGPGGQHRNKTSSAIRITHTPSGITVRSERDRSQHNNRSKAMEMLKTKLYQIELDKQKSEDDENRINREFNGWGNAIRSLSMEPYQLVKDKRTGCQTSAVDEYLAGDLDKFIESSLKIS